MKDQIVKIITNYLNKVEVPKEKWDGTVGFFPAEWPLPTCTIADEIATKLAAAIAPLVNAQAQDFAGWICHQVVAGRTYHKLWLDYCDEKDIAPHLEVGAEIGKIREAFARYVNTEGCSCCRDSKGHEAAEKELAELLKPLPYVDSSGWDWDKPEK